ncbi:MAG: T9SS type A sorting domain-containing protein [Bacteroidetes bacterium]|nr:T9SS type A sorting domain-containing protein [Bacteroidota bacterium]
MKRINFTFIFLFCLSIFFQTNLNAQSVPELLWYKFNETGTNVTNYASTPPAGTAVATIMGGVSQGSTGLCGGALVGSGITASTDYMNTGWATNFTGGSWTLSFWTKDITPSATLFYIFGDAGAGSFRCFTNGVAGANNWILRGTSITDVLVTGAATVAPSMTTFVYDASANTIKAYLNGALINTVTQAGALTNTGAGPFKVGGYGTNVGLPTSGLMDEFRLYNRALTDPEILSLLNLSTTSSITASGCNSYASPSGLYNWTSSGMYNDTLANSAGCDSIITVNLTINNSTSSTINPVGCGSYISPSGNYWDVPNTYFDTIPNANGCDSIITINLTIENVDTMVTQTGISLHANSPIGSFQWLDCNNSFAPIAGANQATFTPASNGSYAVEITTANCVDTSSCIQITTVGIIGIENGSLSVFPNPFNNQLIIDGQENANFEILNSIGQVVYTGKIEGKTIIETSNFAKGVYLIKLEGETKIDFIKIVKE